MNRWMQLRLATLLLIFGVAVGAQESTKPPAAPPPTSSEEASPDHEQGQPGYTFKKNVRTVNLFFNVKDKHGALIPKLAKDEFELSEDGKPQTIKFFSAETDQPLTLGLMIDTSGSQRRVLDIEKEAGGEFVRDVLRPKDLAFLISFDIDVDLLRDFTSSARDIRAAMDKARINTGGSWASGRPGPVPTIGGNRGTVLYDAVYLAAHDMLGKEVGRKAIVLLTDGEDMGSRTKVDEAIEAASRADVIAYVILISDSGAYSGFGEGAMRKLCEQTGGRVIVANNKFDKLKDAFRQISDELRTQYSLGYNSTNTKADGTFRKIEIKSKQGYKVQTRRGYYAASDDE